MQDFVTVAALGVGLVSLLLLWDQNRRVGTSIRSQVYQALIDNSLRIDDLLIERPYLRAYVYDGEPLPDDDQLRAEILSVMELLHDIADNLLAQWRFIPPDLRTGWQFFIDDLQSSPAMAEFRKRHQHWYADHATHKWSDNEANPARNPATEIN